MNLFVMDKENSVRKISDSSTRFISREIFHRKHKIGPTYTNIAYLLGNVRVAQNFGAFA